MVPFTFFKSSDFNSSDCIPIHGALPLIMPEKDSLDIDSTFDLKIANFLFRDDKGEKMNFSIGKSEISVGGEPVIIAEIGINHGGSLEVAKEMARLAIESGADLIKTQTHIPVSEMSVEAESVECRGNANVSIFG